MRKLHYVCGLGVSLSLVTSACSAPRVFSPPSRFALTETAVTPRQGELIVGGEAFGHGEGLWGGTLFGGAAKVRGAATEHVEWNAAASVAYLPDAQLVAVHPNIYAGRVGTKINVHRYLAAFGGVGGGWSAGGGFVSPDLGAVFAIENRYVVPFLAGSLAVSLPIHPRALPVEVTEGEVDFTVNPTFLPAFSTGLRFPFGDAPVGVTTSIDFNYPRDRDKSSSYGGLTLGFDVRI